MTAEILRNRLYKKADSISSIEWVIFDEVHYINNAERGTVWEEIIIMLPKTIGIVMLSATIENTQEFSDWVSRTTGKTLHVIKTYKRPVPLKFNLFYKKDLPIKDEHSALNEIEIAALIKKIKDDDIKKMKQKQAKRAELNEKKNLLAGKSNQKERVKKITAVKTNKNKFKYKAPDQEKLNQQLKFSNEFLSQINFLKKNEKLPAIVFVFSKKTLVSLALNIAKNTDLINGAQKKQIQTFFVNATSKLSDEDKQIRQLLELKEMLLMGVGVHHGDLLPLCKEIVELLL